MKSDILEKVYNRLANEMIKLEEWKKYYELYEKMIEIKLISEETLNDFRKILLNANVVCVNSDENVTYLMNKMKLQNDLSSEIKRG